MADSDSASSNSDSDGLRIAVDPEFSQAWVEVAHSARWMNRVLSSVGDPAVSCKFAQVNAIYPFERSSDWHRSYLGAALQHLLAWADLIAPLKFHPEQTVVPRLRPAYTLARAALEAASQAVWMTAGTSAEECVRRHLSLMRWDFEEHRKSLPDEVAKRRAREMDEALLDRVADRYTDDDLRPPRHLTVLREAAPIADLDADAVERVWRAASGAAHGRVWPDLELQVVVPLHEYEPGQFRALRVPDAAGMAEVLRFADRMVQHGVMRHLDFCGADIQSHLDAAREWLVSVTPMSAHADSAAVAQLRRRSGSRATGESR